MSHRLTFAPIKREQRRAHSLDALAIGDRLFARTAQLMVAHGCYTVPALDYITRKRKALRAAYFRQREGRDFATGQRRHMRDRVRWWNEGYQDEVDGRPLYRRPDGWSLRRWDRYADGVETARNEGRRA